MVKTDDTEFAQFIGLTEFPSIVYYEHGNPHIYDGKESIKSIKSINLTIPCRKNEQIDDFEKIADIEIIAAI